jgi:hypothetical protein
MSHVSTIKLKVMDALCLDIAMNKLGLERRDKQTYRWYGRYMADSPLPEGVTITQLGKCDFAYGIPGSNKAYEIGVVQKADGSFSLLWDYWQNGFGLQEAIGENGCKLISEYEAQVFNSHMTAQGYEMQEQVLEDGTRKISAVRYA